MLMCVDPKAHIKLLNNKDFLPTFSPGQNNLVFFLFSFW